MQQMLARLYDAAGPARAFRSAQAVGSFTSRKPLGAVGLLFVAISILLAIVGPWVTPHDPLEMTRAFLQAPSWTHPFGTDVSGRDMLSRIIGGARVSVYVGFTAVFVASLLGVVVGTASAYYGGKLDLIVQRFVDVMMAFPSLILAIAIMAALGQGLNNVVIAIAFSWAPKVIRVMRGSAMSVKEEQYVEAALALGASSVRIMAVHIFRNTLAPLLIMMTGALADAIVAEATLSFLGLGVPPPYPSWGRMISGDAIRYAQRAPWLTVFPGLVLTLVVYGFNVLGDALRDVWDPRFRDR